MTSVSLQKELSHVPRTIVVKLFNEIFLFRAAVEPFAISDPLPVDRDPVPARVRS